jgi:hypothetical protein
MATPVRDDLLEVSVRVVTRIICFSNLQNGACFVPAVECEGGGFECPSAPPRLLVKVNTGRAAQLDMPETRFALPSRTPVCRAVLRVRSTVGSQPATPVEALRSLPRGSAAANHEEER